MSTIKNQIQLIGNVGQDSMVTKLDSRKKVALLSPAPNENYKNFKGENQIDTQWHTVVFWGKTVGIIEKYLGKGKEIAIKGKLTSRSYENKEGVRLYVSEVVASEILLLGGNA